MIKKPEAIDLVEYMETEIKIDCFGCDATDESWVADEVDFAKDLFKKGWRVTSRGNVYCPKCAKKKLKQ